MEKIIEKVKELIGSLNTLLESYTQEKKSGKKPVKKVTKKYKKSCGKCVKKTLKPSGSVKLNTKGKLTKITCVKFVNQNAIKLNGRTIKPSKTKLDGKIVTIPTAWKAYKTGTFKNIEFFV